jgi:hypothetical protein
MLNQKIEKRKETQIDALVSVESHNFHYFLNKSMIKWTLTKEKSLHLNLVT